MGPGKRPVSGSEYETAVCPAPSAVPPLVGARVPNTSVHAPGSTVLYRNHPVAVDRFGFTVPLSVASVLVTVVAASVVTDGAAVVVNDWMVPKPVPTEFDAMAQK